MDNNQWMPYMQNMEDMNMPMMEAPMMQYGNMYMNMPMHPMVDMEEEEMKMMYPRVYHMIMPMVHHHCDMMEEMHGKMHCPKREEFEDMCKKITKSVEEELDDQCGEDDEKHDHEDDHEHHRIRSYDRGDAVRDIVGILLLNELIGRRRRRRRPRPRPRPYYGYYGY